MERHKLPLDNQLKTDIDWYGIIMEAFCRAAISYKLDNKKNVPFATYAWTCMENAMKVTFKLQTMQKRKEDKNNLSFEALMGNEDSAINFEELLADKFNLEDEVINDLFYKDILNSMPEITQKYINLENLGYSQTEIGKMLGVTRAAVSKRHVAFCKKLAEELKG